MKTSLLGLAAAATLALTPAAYAADSAHADAGAATGAISQARVDTQSALRDLWVEHIFWVRNYVLASKDGDTQRRQVAAHEAVENAKAIAGAVSTYYGKAGGDRMLELLGGHWGAVKDYADAAFAKNAAAQQTAVEKLGANAREIAAFLAKANPYLPEKTLNSLLATHGAQHVTEIQQVAAGDYAAEAKTWNAMRTHMFVIADALTSALAKQFPQKF